MFPVHSANLSDKATETLDNASTAVVSYHIYSISVSRILYALPAWGGFLTVELNIESMPFSGVSSDMTT